MKLKTLVAASLALSLLGLGAVRADTPIYKWVDEQGKVHYSTEPHSDKAQQLNIQNNGTLPNASTKPLPPAAAGQAPAGAAADDATLLQPQPGDSPACKAGRDRLFKYLHADSLYQLDDKGNKQPLSADAKKQALDEARSYVTQACGGGA